MIRWVTALEKWGGNTAIIENGYEVSYTELSALIRQNQRAITSLLLTDKPGILRGEAVTRPLVLVVMDNSLQSVVHYLTCLAYNWPVLLISPKLNKDAIELVEEQFRPNLILSGERQVLASKQQHRLSPELALILMTSGSTGGGKGVAISALNIAANTASICGYLPIESSDITLATMPFSYSYGLSILNTHLSVGACIALSSATLVDKEFWNLLESLPVNSLAGVPHWYEMLVSLRFTRRAWPHLRYFTQAGGKLSPKLIKELSQFADTNQSRFYRMYGQTEATARMGWLEPALAGTKLEAIGKAIPGGEFSLRDEAGKLIENINVIGELYYRGDNCMLGYVESVADLHNFEPQSSLATGDLAMQDHDGDYILKGRKHRIIKLLGERVNLDGLEFLFAGRDLEVKCFGDDSMLYLACSKFSEKQVTALAREFLAFPPKYYSVFVVNNWPLLPNGKTDYMTLMRLAAVLTDD
ncbi:AMP-dependent synthetase [Alteromonas aestuariivivens]|uniref:AMP-dependent synthetase n=1 Tax=Alteromonas aestuariivivens TaxID=1938339 RepID=A0A3D8M616_9ALTE|nr:AMP-binding protein [Alteromonas aestuariivivens]RDV25048.1 AMP-dependent synthetase [Alteromonas aestuariivivens]